MAFLSEKEKEYCDEIIKEAKIYLPFQYRVPLLERAQKEDIRIDGKEINKHHLRNFKRGVFKDLTVADLFKAEIDERKAKLKKSK